MHRLQFAILLATVVIPSVCAAAPPRPNVLLIMTDDQGWGDLGVHGNDKIHTPNLDRLAQESVRLTRFYAGPVCTPTRASVMTGRYHLRTRAIDTYKGRAIMHPDEVTLAEMLRDAGYRTGIFGKWHLGDHYPSRAIDQGFREALIHHGGGIAQPSDPPAGNSYSDPWLEHNGKMQQARGYCSDVFTDATIDFIEGSVTARQPFFAYLAFNAPHVPLQVPDELVKPYRDAGLDDRTARLYAMVTNIDANVGRVLRTLSDHKLAEDTLVIFMTDNGPQTPRYNGALRGLKGTVYEGGIRVPCFVRWPAGFKGGGQVERPAAHVDLMPTILSACRVEPPGDVKLDGMNLLPVLSTGGLDDGVWPARTLYFQWHRGDAAVLGRGCAAISNRYKLVHTGDDAAWELYDLLQDPAEQRNLGAAHADVVARMRADYEAWFNDVSGTRGYAPVPIHVGSEHENPVLLTRQDRREPEPGSWQIHVARDAAYAVTVLFDPAEGGRKVTLKIGGQTLTDHAPDGSGAKVFQDVRLERGDVRLEAWVGPDEKRVGATYVRIERKE